MKKLLAMFCGLFLLLAGYNAVAAGTGTANDATALVKKAAAFYKQAGKEKALAEFNKSNSAYIDRDLYIFVIDMDGKTLANGVNPKIVGKNVIDMKDADGKPFIRQFIDIAKTKGSGWLDYQWPDPVTKSVRSKSTYVEKVDDVVIGCGVYK